jgi:hypothetical protein
MSPHGCKRKGGLLWRRKIFMIRTPLFLIHQGTAYARRPLSRTCPRTIASRELGTARVAVAIIRDRILMYSYLAINWFVILCDRSWLVTSG